MNAVKTTNAINAFVNNVIASTSPYVHELIAPSCNYTQLTPYSGSYVHFRTHIIIPYENESGETLFHYTTVEGLWRIRGGRGSAYRAKVNVPDADVFRGKADWQPKTAWAIYEVMDTFRCACDGFANYERVALFF